VSEPHWIHAVARRICVVVWRVFAMAVSSKKLKGNKDGEKKQTKKLEEEVARIEDRKEEPVTEVDLVSPSVEQVLGSSVSQLPPLASEPVYEEPLLTLLIVSRFVPNL